MIFDRLIDGLSAETVFDVGNMRMAFNVELSR